MRRSWSCPPGQGAAMPGRRGGIRLRFDPCVDPEVRRALMQFVRWLQTQYAFPVRVPVYVRAAERLLCRDGDLACGTFLGPSDPEQEPYSTLPSAITCSCSQRGDRTVRWHRSCARLRTS